jgi:hypothetical protein
VSTAQLRIVKHDIHSTTMDARDFSYARKTAPPLHYPERPAPQRIADIVKDIYNATKERYSQYLARPLQPLLTRYAATATLQKPGDDASEGHTDYHPSVQSYIMVPSSGGHLFIARSARARSIELIRDNAYEIIPEPATVAMFDGSNYAHFVDGIPSGAFGVRAGVNTSFLDETAQNHVPHVRQLS